MANIDKISLITHLHYEWHFTFAAQPPRRREGEDEKKFEWVISHQFPHPHRHHQWAISYQSTYTLPTKAKSSTVTIVWIKFKMHLFWQKYQHMWGVGSKTQYWKKKFLYFHNYSFDLINFLHIFFCYRRIWHFKSSWTCMICYKFIKQHKSLKWYLLTYLFHHPRTFPADLQCCG